MTRSATLDRLNKVRKTPIVNKPDDYAMSNLRVLCQSLELIRTKLGEPLYITSGYRNEILNGYVGGSGFSLHMKGAAADISLPLNKAIVAAQYAMNLPHAKEALLRTATSSATSPSLVIRILAASPVMQEEPSKAVPVPQ